MSSKDSQWMRIALDEARGAYDRGEVPVGAVLISASGDELARAGNRIEELNDPTAHAEIMAIREAANIAGSPRLVGTTLYVTLEPCPMCAGAAFWTRVGRIVFGASDAKRGYRMWMNPGQASLTHPKTTVDRGILEEECSQLLKDFFAAKRKQR